MDSLIAFKGKDYVIMAADTFNAYSILRMKVIAKLMLVLWLEKYAVCMVKEWPLEANILMYLPLVTTSKRI